MSIQLGPTTVLVSAIGRFKSEDPLGFKAGDTDLYRYVGNKVLILVDPLGTLQQVPGLAWGYHIEGRVFRQDVLFGVLPLPEAGPMQLPPDQNVPVLGGRPLPEQAWPELGYVHFTAIVLFAGLPIGYYDEIAVIRLGSYEDTLETGPFATSVYVRVYKVDELVGEGPSTSNYWPQIRGSGTAGAPTQINILNRGTQVNVGKTVVLFQLGFRRPKRATVDI